MLRADGGRHARYARHAPRGVDTTHDPNEAAREGSVPIASEVTASPWAPREVGHVRLDEIRLARRAGGSFITSIQTEIGA